MEERVTTSFIPKASLEAPVARRPGGNPLALANIICGALLVVAIAASAGLYFFESYTNTQITAKQASLARSREAFQPETIKQLSRLDTRLSSGSLILSSHLSVSTLFDELEKLTLSSVRYDKFEYSMAAPGHVVLTMSGEAASFNAVALQAEAFAKSPIITDPIFSNVNVGRTGSITFDFTAIVDISHMRYVPSMTASSTPFAPAGSTQPQQTVPQGAGTQGTGTQQPTH